MRQMKRFTAILLCLGMLAGLCACGTGTEPVDPDVIDADLQKVAQSIPCMRRPDGGFSQIPSLSYAYLPLYDTYYALADLSLLGAELPDPDAVRQYLGGVTLEDLFGDPNDDMANVYHYCRLAELTGFTIPESLRKNILQSLSQMQDDGGYLYTAVELAAGAAESKSPDSPAVMSAFVQIGPILRILGAQESPPIRTDALFSFAERALESVDPTALVERDLTLLSAYFETADAFGRPARLPEGLDLADYCGWWTRVLPSGDGFSLETLRNLCVCAVHADGADLDALRGAAEAYLDRCFDGTAYRPFPDDGSPHVRSVYAALEIRALLGLPPEADERTQSLLSFIGGGRFYDGSYLFLEGDSGLSATYTAVSLSELLEPGTFRDDGALADYVAAQIGENGGYTPELLYLAQACGLEQDEAQVRAFLDAEFEQLPDTIAHRDPEDVFLLFELAKDRGLDVRAQAEQAAAAYQSLAAAADAPGPEAELYAKSYGLRIACLSGLPVSQEDADGLVRLFVSDYDKLGNPTAAAAGVIAVLRLSGARAPKAFLKMRDKIVGSVYDGRADAFFGYGEGDPPSYAATRDAVTVLHYFTEDV